MRGVLLRELVLHLHQRVVELLFQQLKPRVFRDEVGVRPRVPRRLLLEALRDDIRLQIGESLPWKHVLERVERGRFARVGIDAVGRRDRAELLVEHLGLGDLELGELGGEE
jgi:hypothetical protein